MGRTGIITLGLLALLVLSLLCATYHRRSIETDLVAAGETALATKGFDWAQITASGCVLHVSGSPPGSSQLTAALGILSNLPGACRATRSIARPGMSEPGPATLAFKLEAVLTADQLRLSGRVPDQPTRDTLLALASKSSGIADVVDELEVTTGSTSGSAEWNNTALAFLDQLTRMPSGRLTIEGRQVTLSGLVQTEIESEAARVKLLTSLPDGFRARYDLAAIDGTSLVEKDLCQQLFDEFLSNTTIKFSTSSAIIQSGSFGLLDRLALTAGRCPAARIEISGHTDSRGNKESNLRLSRERANAVVKYLLQTGVESGRLAAVGYGADRPLADDSTAQGRLLNRRIEFRVE